MSDHCEVCPALRAENAMLQRHIAELQARLASTAAGLRGLAVLIETEMQEPTMPWRELLPLVALRADNLADQAQGRY